MQAVDFLFLFLLFFVQPIYSAIGYRELRQQVENGETPDRIGFFKSTIYIQWGALLVFSITWLSLSRPFNEIGFLWPTELGWWLGVGVVVLGSAGLGYSIFNIRQMSEEQKQEQRDAGGLVLHLLPTNREELQYSYVLSVTAGIVEEIIYRGFVLWCLGHFMPLWAAALISSVGFGLGHSYQGFGGVIKTGLLGLFFAGFYLLSGSLLFPIIAHILLDALQMRMVYDLQTEDEPQTSS